MRNAGRSLVALGIIAVLATVLASPVFAARGGGSGGGKPGSSGTIDIVELDSTDGLTHFGQHVTFVVSTDATAYPWVEVRCFQNGDQVYRQANGIFPTSLNQVFTLGPTPSWSGGDADCTAALQDWDSYSKNEKKVTITTMDFRVYA
jgi:hypothetical protein